MQIAVGLLEAVLGVRKHVQEVTQLALRTTVIVAQACLLNCENIKLV